MLRPLPNFGEHFRVTGEFCRQFLVNLPAAVRTGRLELENRRGLQSAIEAACFLRGRIIASNIEDAQRDVDRRLVQATWEIIQSYVSRTNSSYPKQTDLNQLQAFLLESQEVASVTEQPNNVLVVADQTTVPAKLTKKPKDGGHDYAGYTQSAFDAYQGPPHFYPLQFQQNVADMSFIPVQNTYIGPYVYPVTYPPLQSEYHDQTLQPQFPTQIYGEPSLSQPIFQNMNPQVEDVTRTSHLPPNNRIQELQNVETGGAPGLSQIPKRGRNSSFQAEQGFECVKARPVKRQRKLPSAPHPIAPIAEAPATGWVDDVFVDETPSSFADSVCKRKKLTDEQGTRGERGDHG